MIFAKKEIVLKNGEKAILRSPEKEDGEKLLNLIKTASGETENLLRYPEEWNLSIEQEEAWIESGLKDTDSINIVCFIGNDAAGSCEIRRLMGKKMRHRATIGISILKKYWNLGIGSALFVEMINFAEENDIEIIELEFIEGNERAQKLYEKFGFKVISERPNAFKLKDGSYRSEFYMQKLLK